MTTYGSFEISLEIVFENCLFWPVNYCSTDPEFGNNFSFLLVLSYLDSMLFVKKVDAWLISWVATIAGVSFGGKILLLTLPTCGIWPSVMATNYYIRFELP